MRVYHDALPGWYPERRHLQPVPLSEWVAALDKAATIAQEYALFSDIPLRYSHDKRYLLARSFGRFRLYKVLDYIELYAWAADNDVSYSSAFLADAFWNDIEINPYQRLMRWTRPVAASVMSPHGLHILKTTAWHFPSQHL